MEQDSHFEEHVTLQAPCFAVTRTVSPVRIHSPVRPVPATRSCRARVSIQPGWVVPALRSRPPVRLHGPVYPVPAPCIKPPVCLPSLVSPVPAPRARPPVCLSTPSAPSEFTRRRSSALPRTTFSQLAQFDWLLSDSNCNRLKEELMRCTLF